MKDFRPISLCNVLYKIVAKVLANMMKKVLNDIIGENQIAFIPGRMIFDNIMDAYESIRSMKNRRSGSQAYMALKVDMSKAYDRVEWNYLEAIMVTMGFSDRWTKWTCVRSVQYSILINGKRYGEIQPSRGLRQGVPISPYLSLLCAEGLSSLLTKADGNGQIKGISVARSAPRISHLFFADDSLFFCRATRHDEDNIIRILQLYEEVSGQKVNIEKSAVYFSSNTGEDSQTDLKQRLGVSKSLNG